MADEPYLTIEPDQRSEGVWVVLHDTWKKGSVLEGYPRRGLIKHYACNDDALIDYPVAVVYGHSTKDDFAGVSASQVPPGWFDPLMAGEQWAEDDDDLGDYL